MYKLSTMIDRNVDSVMMIILRQKYAPRNNTAKTVHITGVYLGYYISGYVHTAARYRLRTQHVTKNRF